ncbi:hypothetical protein ACWDTT_33330, partial [Streptosporangium sandarakinum]
MKFDPRAIQVMTQSDRDFLYGDQGAALMLDDDRRCEGMVWKRTLRDAGLAPEFDRMGVTLEELPEDRVTLFVTPAEMRVGNIHI